MWHTYIADPPIHNIPDAWTKRYFCYEKITQKFTPFQNPKNPFANFALWVCSLLTVRNRAVAVANKAMNTIQSLELNQQNNTYIHTVYIHTYMHTYIHVYIHACMHACMHAYTHTLTYIQSYKFFSDVFFLPFLYRQLKLLFKKSHDFRIGCKLILLFHVLHSTSTDIPPQPLIPWTCMHTWMS